MQRLTNRKTGAERNFLLPEDIRTQSLIYQKLAEYEDLEEHGRLVILPEDYSDTDSSRDLTRKAAAGNNLAASSAGGLSNAGG